MIFDRWTLSASAIAALLSPALVGYAPLPSPRTDSSAPPALVSLNFPSSPSNGRRPERTASGGARSICYVEGLKEQAIPMTVLMPENNVGTTVDDDPALFIYIPKSRIDGGQVIVFEPESDREVYLREFDLSNKPGDTAGVIKIDLQEANLESGKIYDWVFSPFCLEDGETLFLGDTFVEGSFQRTELTSIQNTQLERAETLLEQAEIYARSGIWNETLSLAEQLRSSDPQEWTNLLKSVKLEELAEAPYFGEVQLILEDEESSESEAILPDFSEPEETNAPPDRDTAPF